MNNTLTTNDHQAELHELKEFMRRHGWRWIIAICAALIISGIPVYYKHHRKTSKENASVMLASARTVQDIESIVADYPSAPTAPFAVMRLAKIYFDSGNYDLALLKYDEVKKNFPDHEMAVAAESGRIHCLEAKNQLEEAASAFSAFAAAHPGHYLSTQAIFGEARCLTQLGRHAEAKTLYEDFIAANPKSGWLPVAEELLSAANKKLDVEPKKAEEK